jgi:predicted protein tyrosine phosphatase
VSILVCPLSRVEEMVALHQPGRVISLLDPDWPFPDLGDRYRGRHLRLRVHDICEAEEHLVVPGLSHVRALLGFLAGWTRERPLLIHCRAGLSRSTATAFIAACFVNPGTEEHDIALALRRAAPLARPNTTLVALADAEMGRGGRMTSAIFTTGRDLLWPEVDEGEPFHLVIRPSAPDLPAPTTH